MLTLVDFKAPPGLVLCFGPDGHIELEHAVNEGCCAPEPHEEMDAPAMKAVTANPCGDCSDLPLFSTLGNETLHRFIAAQGGGMETAAIAPSIQYFQYVTRRIEKTRGVFPPACPQVMASIRSVRLLV